MPSLLLDRELRTGFSDYFADMPSLLLERELRPLGVLSKVPALQKAFAAAQGTTFPQSGVKSRVE